MAPVTQFDFETGLWRRPDPLDREGIVVSVAGDLAPIRAFSGIMENTPEDIFGNLLPGLVEADLTIVNLECPLSNMGRPVQKSGSVFKGKKAHIKALEAVPFDAVTLANNHVLDYGVQAFEDTLKTLDNAQIKRVGAGKDIKEAFAPLILEKKGIRIGVINFSEGEDLTAADEDSPGVAGWDLDFVCARVKSLKGKVDCIMVIAHCGIEYIPFPPPYVNQAFERVADAGADIVIAHHPHVPQGVRFYNQVPIFFSLGNFVFYQPTDLKFRKLGFTLDIGVDKKGLASYEVKPYVIRDSGLSLLKARARKEFFQYFRDISLPLQSNATLEQAWHAFLCYYGTKGFLNEIESILIRLKTNPRKGAAMMRNRLTTLQHFHHWKDTMTGIIADNLKDPVEWGDRIIKLYMTDTGQIPDE